VRVSALEGHRVWASSYDAGDNPLLALERRSMANLLHSFRPTTAVDIGCGSGRWLLHLQKAGVDVIGVDFCEEMLAEARRYPSLRGRLALGDAEHLPIRAEAADLVLSSMALGYFADLKKAFQEFARVATARACIAISDLHPAAIAAGWTRSFRAETNLYEIDHHRRTIDEIDDAAHRAGRRSLIGQTAYLGPPELAIFQLSGKAERYEEVSQTPALYLHVWEKPC
jgi:ubiquinone/menaquinone biosynthesis C-methylase UbiE